MAGALETGVATIGDCVMIIQKTASRISRRRDENLIRNLGYYSKPSHEGYRNTIELLKGNNVVPLRSDTILLVQNGCSFHGLRSEDPNQHLKDFLKLVDSLDLDVANKERTRLRSISTWEDLTTCFLAQFFPPGRTIKLRNDILMFQQHQENLFLKHGLVSRTYSKRSLIMALIFGSKSKSFMTMSILPQDEPSINRPVVSNLLPQEVRHRVNKISSSYEICSGPYDTQYCMENPKQAFVNYVSSRNDEVGGRFQKLDDTPTPDTAGNSMAHMNLASTGRIKK
ncbi:MAK10-like protein [Tanacetum coccineum]